MATKALGVRPLLSEDESLRIGSDFRRSAWSAFLFCLPYLKPHLRRLVLVSLADICLVFLIAILPWYGTLLIDRAFPDHDVRLAITLVILFVITGIIAQGVTALRTYLYGYVELRIPFDLKTKLYRHVQRLSLNTIERTPVGEYMFRINTDTDRVAHTIYRIIPTFNMVVEFVLILAFSTYTDPLITVIVLAFLIPWTILFYWVTSISRVLDRRRLRCCEFRDSGIQEAASSFGQIKAFGNTRLERFRNGRRSVAAQRVAVHGYLFLVPFEWLTQKVLPYAKNAIVFVYLAKKVILGQMSLGMTVPLTAYLTRLNFPIERIVNFANWVRQTMISVERMMQILQTEPSIKDKHAAIRIERFSGRLRLNHVSYHRAGTSQQLHEISLTLEPGRKVAVVGPSGAGKSTLIATILRMIAPDSGAVLIHDEVQGENISLQDVALDTFLSQTACVVQETFVFGGTIAENLRFAKPDASDEEVIVALDKVGLLDWVLSMPDGIDQDISSGAMISIGQRQRLGIARAILAEPALLILDEPTSALDATTEAEIVKLLSEFGQGRAVLLVTHRLDTVVDADEILVFDRGHVVQRGTHYELGAVSGLYRDLLEAYRYHHPESALPEASIL